MRDAYGEWFWRTWPNHALADPEAKRKQKAVLQLIEGTIGAILGVAIVATIVSRNAPGGNFADALAAIIDKAGEPLSTNSASDTSPASDTATDTGSDTPEAPSA